MPAHRRTLIAAGAAAALALTGCAGLFGPPVITLTQADIEGLLQRQFPLERRLLEVFEVSVARPQVRLLPDRNRLAAVIDVQVRDRLLGGSWTAQLAFDAMLRWEPRDQTLRLAQVRVQDLVLGPGAPVRSVAERIAALLVEGMLEGQMLYRLAPERAAELRRRGLQPGTVEVGARGVEITFVPLAP
jgi:hypothetical protein